MLNMSAWRAAWGAVLAAASQAGGPGVPASVLGCLGQALWGAAPSGLGRWEHGKKTQVSGEPFPFSQEAKRPRARPRRQVWGAGRNGGVSLGWGAPAHGGTCSESQLSSERRWKPLS